MTALRAFALRARGRAAEAEPILDADGDPAEPCPACAGRAFHSLPDAPWTCSGRQPFVPPADLAGWAFCHLPESSA